MAKRPYMFSGIERFSPLTPPPLSHKGGEGELN